MSCPVCLLIKVRTIVVLSFIIKYIIAILEQLTETRLTISTEDSLVNNHYSALLFCGKWIVLCAIRGYEDTWRYAGRLRNTWCGVAWRGVAWRGVAWRGVAWRGVAWRGVAWRGVAWRGVAWRGRAWHGMAWHGMAWHGMAWHGMAWHGIFIFHSQYNVISKNSTHTANERRCCLTTIIVVLNIIYLYINKEAIVVMVPPIHMIHVVNDITNNTK